MTSVRLSRQQVDALLVRLRELGIRPNLVVTAMWRCGWVVPPIELQPLAWFLVYFLWIYGGYMWLLMLVTEKFGAGSLLWFGTLGGFMVVNLALYHVTPRTRMHAVVALACLIGVPIVYAGWLLTQPAYTGNFVPPVTFSMLLHDTFARTIVIALLIGLAFRHYRFRRKMGRLNWREMVAETQVANIF
jgi:hypothetical protein